ncbi:hypothetical protein HG531_009669 [Fusarium graminearum]|nr:hypothetical protein HG531_009669 [Fusarium graminearum]
MDALALAFCTGSTMMKVLRLDWPLTCTPLQDPIGDILRIFLLAQVHVQSVVTSHIRLDHLVLDILVLGEFHRGFIAAGLVVVSVAEPERLYFLAQLYRPRLQSRRAVEKRCQAFQRTCVMAEGIFLEALCHLRFARQIHDVELMLDLESRQNLASYPACCNLERAWDFFRRESDEGCLENPTTHLADEFGVLRIGSKHENLTAAH